MFLVQITPLQTNAAHAPLGQHACRACTHRGEASPAGRAVSSQHTPHLASMLYTQPHTVSLLPLYALRLLNTNNTPVLHNTKPQHTHTHLQVDYLRRLNRAGRSETVVQAFESGSIANTEEAMGEYLKALVRLDALDGSRLASTLQQGAQASFAARGLAPAAAAAGGYMPPPAAAAAPNLPWYAAGAQYGSGGGGGGGFGSAAAAALAAAGVAGGNSSSACGDIGTPRNPLVVTHAEPSLMSQVRSDQ